jgi:hypothetical protein
LRATPVAGAEWTTSSGEAEIMNGSVGDEFLLLRTREQKKRQQLRLQLKSAQKCTAFFDEICQNQTPICPKLLTKAGGGTNICK